MHKMYDKLSKKCSQRMNKPKFDMKHFYDTLTTVSMHFNLPVYTNPYFSFVPFDIVPGNWQKTTEGTERVGTVTPFGLNSKIMY